MSVRFTGEGAEQIYAAAEQWVDCALRTDGSLFTPGKAIWTGELLGEVSRALNAHNSRRASFWENLAEALDGQQAPAFQLLAEAIYVHFLPRYADYTRYKRVPVTTVIEASPEMLREIPDQGKGIPSLVMTGRDAWIQPFYCVMTLSEVLVRWKGLESGSRDTLIENPWEFKKFLFDRIYLSENPAITGGGAAVARQLDMLLHLIFPDTFEPLFPEDKEAICKAKAFAPFFSSRESDIDHKIQQIRHAIEEKKGEGFDFYDSDILRYWKLENSQALVEDFDAGENLTTPPAAVDLQPLADKTYLPVSFLENIKELLVEKRQVIFQGPPGTGKTFLARELGRFLAGIEGRVTLVQFHPSYAYEDFVQGFRPALKDGQTGFELRNGPLLRAAERARQEPRASHYLIIDEINRGNLATVFGESYFLLEYRGDKEKIRLQYSDEDFTLPENLFIIGTMNTADRSIAMVDLALRRRFYFVEFHPEKEPVNGVLQQWLEQRAKGMEWVAAVVKEANQRLADADAAIGPSYFMRPEGLTPDKVDLIWKHSVLPYIAERLFNERGRLAEFELENLRKAVSSGAEDGNVTGTGEGDGNDGGEGEA